MGVRGRGFHTPFLGLRKKHTKFLMKSLAAFVTGKALPHVESAKNHRKSLLITNFDLVVWGRFKKN